MAEKTLGQIAYETFTGNWAEWPVENQSYRDSWEAAAQAVSAALPQPGPAPSWELVEKALSDIKAEVDLNLPCPAFDIDEDDMDVHVDDCIGCTIMDSVRAALLEIERARQEAGIK